MTINVKINSGQKNNNNIVITMYHVGWVLDLSRDHSVNYIV